MKMILGWIQRKLLEKFQNEYMDEFQKDFPAGIPTRTPAKVTEKLLEKCQDESQKYLEFSRHCKLLEIPVICEIPERLPKKHAIRYSEESQKELLMDRKKSFGESLPRRTFRWTREWTSSGISESWKHYRSNFCENFGARNIWVDSRTLQGEYPTT